MKQSVRRKRRRAPRAQLTLSVQGFTAAQLGAKVGISARTVRYYAAQRVLPAPQFRGAGTRYVHEHLVRLAAIRYLLRDHRRTLTQIRLLLASKSPAELERMAAQVLPELAATAPRAVPGASTAPTAHAALATWNTSTWQRVTALPGVEVHLQDGATEVAIEIANALTKDAQRKWLEHLAAASTTA